MKNLYIILPIIVSLIISSCQTASPTIDFVSIQNTAVAQAWTTVAQTQLIGLAATVNVQGTQIAILNQPTETIPPPTSVVTPVNDNNIKVALLAILGWSESDTIFSTQYNDGQRAIGRILNTNHMKVSPTDTDAFWIAQKDSIGLWGIIYISHGLTPPCKELQKFNIDVSQNSLQCLDTNGNLMMLWQWQGQ